MFQLTNIAYYHQLKPFSRLQAEKNVPSWHLFPFQGVYCRPPSPNPPQGIQTPEWWRLFFSSVLDNGPFYVSCQNWVASSILLHPKDRCCLLRNADGPSLTGGQLLPRSVKPAVFQRLCAHNLAQSCRSAGPRRGEAGVAAELCETEQGGRETPNGEVDGWHLNCPSYFGLKKKHSEATEGAAINPHRRQIPIEVHGRGSYRCCARLHRGHSLQYKDRLCTGAPGGVLVSTLLLTRYPAGFNVSSLSWACFLNVRNKAWQTYFALPGRE